MGVEKGFTASLASLRGCPAQSLGWTDREPHESQARQHRPLGTCFLLYGLGMQLRIPHGYLSFPICERCLTSSMHPDVGRGSWVIPVTDQGHKGRGKAKACGNWARGAGGSEARQQAAVSQARSDVLGQAGPGGLGVAAPPLWEFPPVGVIENRLREDREYKR